MLSLVEANAIGWHNRDVLRLQAQPVVPAFLWRRLGSRMEHARRATLEDGLYPGATGSPPSGCSGAERLLLD